MRYLKIEICLFILVLGCGLYGGCRTARESAAGTVYFLVAEILPFHNDSYILPLTKAEDIAAARNIIVSGTPKIVMSNIARGSGDGNYRNQDLVEPGKRVWSWHVVEFLEFADVSAEIYDGWPTYVEEHLEEWLATKKARIGFWSYTVSREVNISEIQ
jgi:hypothetical protein